MCYNPRASPDCQEDEGVHHRYQDQRKEQHHEEVSSQDVVPRVGVVHSQRGRTNLSNFKRMSSQIRMNLMYLCYIDSPNLVICFLCYVLFSSTSVQLKKSIKIFMRGLTLKRFNTTSVHSNRRIKLPQEKCKIVH